MIRPKHFAFNAETASSNAFQKNQDNGESSQIIGDEFDRAVAKIRAAGIQVQVFEDGNLTLPDAVFPNNWLACLPDKTLTIFPMLAENRRLEVRQDILDWVIDRVKIKQVIDLRTFAKNNQFLEGTGSLVFDHFNRIAYACESPRTSIELFELYCEKIGYTPFSFESLDLNGRPIYHTNVMMSIAEKYVLVSIDSVENQLERSFLKAKLALGGKKMITLSYAQMAAFAGNVFEVQDENGHSFLILSETAKQSLTVEQLEIITVFSTLIEVDVQTIEQIGGGGIRCMVAGIFV